MKELKIERVCIENFKTFKDGALSCSKKKYNTSTTITLTVEDIDLNKLNDILASPVINVTFKVEDF